MKESKKESRPLLPEEIEVRIDSYSDNSFTVVTYVNPRTSMYYLDDVYGPENWSKKLLKVDKKSPDTPFYAVCRLEIRMPDGTLVIRDDVGQDFDSPKSAVSDSIKRAAMNFIPTLRALYTLPTLRIPVSNLGMSVVGKENVRNEVRFKKFSVNSISFGDGATGKFVKAIQIADDDTGDIVYEYTSKRTTLSKGDSEEVLELRTLMIQAAVSEEELLKRYKKAFKVSSLSEIADTENLFESAKKYLEAKKTEKKSSVAGSSINDQLKGGSKKKKKEE